MLTEYGKKVRKARIDAGVTMTQMATDLGTTPSFLSAMETGRKNVPAEWVGNVERYFKERGVSVSELGAAADASNQSVSLEGLSREHQMLVAGFARALSSSPSVEDVNAFKSLLQGIQGVKKR
jgi:transcriptional regulator with XRE-family HTH domain